MSIDKGSDVAGSESRPLVILVVEDEVLVRMLACDILTEAGYHPIEAVNAEEAMILIEARPDIAVLFTDVDMPGELNGFGLARLVALRSPTLPIIVTSGAGSPSPTDLPNGGRFLQKPYSPSALLDLIAEVTGLAVLARRPAEPGDAL